MKKTVILIGVLLTMLFGVYGCGSSENENSIVSESSLASNASTNVGEDHKILLKLEHPQSISTDGDLEDIGSDCYTFKPSKDIDANLFIDPNMPIDRIEIKDLETLNYYVVKKDDVNPSYLFSQYDSYKICVHHDGEAAHDQLLTINFSDSNIPGSSSMTMNTGCDYQEHDLSGCVFRPGHSTCDGKVPGPIDDNFTFRHCDLTGADLRDTIIQVPTPFAKFNNIKVNNRDSDGDGQRHTGTKIYLTEFSGMEIENVDLTSVETFIWPSGNKAHISFKNSILGDKISFKEPGTFINISNVIFEGSDLSNATLSGITFDNVNFKDANLSQATLDYAVFTNGTTLNNTNFTDSFLENASFETGISNTYLTEVDFSGATLYGTTFDFITIDKCTFKNCKTDEQTSVVYSELKNMDLEQLSFLAKSYVDMSNTTQDTIKWSFTGKPSGYSCSPAWYETLNTYSNCDWNEEHGHIGGGEDPGCKDAKYWKDNYFCSNEDLRFVFDNAGWYDGDHIRLYETSDRSWDDNYLSYITKHSINFYWISNGIISEKLCVNIEEPSDASNTWWDNYVCFDFD